MITMVLFKVSSTTSPVIGGASLKNLLNGKPWKTRDRSHRIRAARHRMMTVIEWIRCSGKIKTSSVEDSTAAAPNPKFCSVQVQESCWLMKGY